MNPETMYKLFLEGIRKANTGVVPPTSFNYLINEWGQYSWLDKLIPDFEKDQYVQDQLAPLVVITDGVFKYDNITLKPIEATNDKYFPYPYNSDNLEIDSIVYPEYYRGLRFQFKIEYVDDECETGISNWLKGIVMRTDLQNEVLDNPYRAPSGRKLYYKIRKNVIELFSDRHKAKEMKLEYIKKPIRINYDSDPTKNVSSEFSYTSNREIIDHAVRIFIERVRDPRYESLLNELSIKLLNK